MLFDHASSSVSETFDELFEVRLAKTDQERDMAFRLRYQVYCLEQGFEDPAKFPHQRETDEFDPVARHALLYYRPTMSAVGTVRLIPAVGLASLPLDKLASDPRSYIKTADPLDKPHIAEISRFCIARSMRRRDGEDVHADIKWPYDTKRCELRRQMPNLSLGLMQAVVLMAREQGVRDVCAVMEPALLVLLKRLGISFDPLGPRVEYRGIRQPCYRSLDDISTEVLAKNTDVWSVIFGDTNDRFSIKNALGKVVCENEPDIYQKAS